MTVLVTAIPAAAQETGALDVTGVGTGLSTGLGLGSTVSANPCALYEPNTSCINARGNTVTLGFTGHDTQKLTCANAPPTYSEFPYVATNEYSVDTDASSHAFTDPGIPLDFYGNDPTTGKDLWLSYSIEISNFGPKKTFTPVLACT
jgi:hypothetical protein